VFTPAGFGHSRVFPEKPALAHAKENEGNASQRHVRPDWIGRTTDWKMGARAGGFKILLLAGRFDLSR
jgi:hypothetical protein